jgi:hypothetical protein
VYQLFTLQAGGAPIWSDGNDATSTYTHFLPGGTDLPVIGWLDQLNPVVAAEVDKISIVAKLSHDGTSGESQYPLIVSLLYANPGGTATVSGDDIVGFRSIPTSSTGEVEFVLDDVDAAFNGHSLAEVADRLTRTPASGANGMRCVQFEMGASDTISPPSGTSRKVTIYEASVRVYSGALGRLRVLVDRDGATLNKRWKFMSPKTGENT